MDVVTRILMVDKQGLSDSILLKVSSRESFFIAVIWAYCKPKDLGHIWLCYISVHFTQWALQKYSNRQNFPTHLEVTVFRQIKNIVQECGKLVRMLTI